MSETDPHRTSTTPERLTLLTDGIVELRKRRQIAAPRASGPADPEGRLVAMARRAAARAGHPLA
ncbi:hypothetical protein M8Z33_26520 [Streptomyces sp. ZAF1911]|nr:hypothetical protein [Streptomyces sp. ZAF1911]MDD9380145.1 hypothetical protein [Streptomyces sp. ZAF1911]